MKTRQFNETPTIENDRRTLAKHLIEEHGSNQIATHAAPAQMLEDVHADYHKAGKR